MLAALGTIFGIGFRFIQQPSINVNQPSTEPVAETQPVSQDPSQPSDSPGFYNPCAHGNQCRNDPPTIEQQLEKVGDKLNPSNPDSAPRELGRKLDPTSW